jgi:hypothetical protein
LIDLAKNACSLKADFVKNYNGGRAHLHEIIPLAPSSLLPVDSSHLGLLHLFAKSNPIYFGSNDITALGVPCKVYEGDINEYWLSSIKHDTSYQPFYPTWILSAYLLALAAKDLGFSEVVDIGSGDGRIAYCSKVTGLGAHGIEIDGALADLQKNLMDKTGMDFGVVHADATRFDYSTLELTKPVFFISGLPEMGEMLAQSVVSQVLKMPSLQKAGFAFMGSHSPRKYARDLSQWGWGSVIERYGLDVVQTVTLPTQWTADQAADTPYVFAIPL